MKKDYKKRGYDSDGEYYFTVPKAKIDVVLDCINKGNSRVWQIEKTSGLTVDEVHFSIGQLLTQKLIKREGNGIIEAYFPIGKKVKRVIYGSVQAVKKTKANDQRK